MTRRFIPIPKPSKPFGEMTKAESRAWAEEASDFVGRYMEADPDAPPWLRPITRKLSPEEEITTMVFGAHPADYSDDYRQFGHFPNETMNLRQIFEDYHEGWDWDIIDMRIKWSKVNGYPIPPTS